MTTTIRKESWYPYYMPSMIGDGKVPVPFEYEDWIDYCLVENLFVDQQEKLRVVYRLHIKSEAQENEERRESWRKAGILKERA